MNATALNHKVTKDTKEERSLFVSVMPFVVPAVVRLPEGSTTLRREFGVLDYFGRFAKGLMGKEELLARRFRQMIASTAAVER